MSSPELTKLACAAQTGDASAYQKLLTQLLPMARAYVAKRTNHSEETEDVTQEILVSVHHALPSYQADQPFEPWFYAICRFRLMDHFRQLYKKNDRETDLEDPNLFSDPEKETVTEGLEKREQVNKALKRLNEKQRRIVLMLKVQGYSTAEVAENLNMNISAVKVAAHRALKKMRESLKK